MPFWNRRYVRINFITFQCPVPNVWHQVGIDLIDPLPTTLNGNKYVVTLVDYFSKW